MAAQRPVVLVFQEYATLSTTPATPELNCLIMGAAYHIRDFPDDRANIQLPATYGTLHHSSPYTPPAAAPTVAVDILNPPDIAVGAVLDPTSAKVYFGNGQAIIAAGADGTVTAKSPLFTSAAMDLNTAGVLAGDTCIITDASSNTLVLTVRSVGLTVAQGGTTTTTRQCTFTDDIPSSPFVAGTGLAFRFERSVPEQLISSSYVNVVAGTNEIQIYGGVYVMVAGVSRVVAYGEIYVAYRALRQDLAAMGTLNSVLDVPGLLGRIDARNPLAAGTFVALENTNTPIEYFGVVSNDLVGFNLGRSAISGRKDVYAVVPLIQDINVIAAFAAENTNMADPNYALTNGIPQKFRVVIGQPTPLPTEKIVVDVSAGFAEVPPSTPPTPTAYSTVDVTGATFATAGVLPGDLLNLSNPLLSGLPAGAYPIAHVNSETEVEVDHDFGSASAPTGTDDVTVTRTGVVTPLVSLTGAVTASKLSNALFLDMYDPAGSFLSSGVIPGDYLEIPHNAVVVGSVIPTDYTAMDRYQIAAVLSNQRVRVSQYNTGSVNLSVDTSLLAKELPHAYSRYVPDTIITLDTTKLSYRVMRTLDHAGQATALVSVAQSLANRRAVIVWPDLVDVAGLVDGSLPRTSAAPATPVAAGSQPGFYLACTVGGMTAALPSHQGFTNLGIAGIEKLYHSNTLFEDRYITEISNSGWFVFQQDTPQALPYCVHQLTTDPSTLEFGEYSMVKNMDFVSLYFADIVNEFIGPWNINPETIGFMSTAVTTGIGTLKLQKRAKIGAPIITGKISQLAQSTLSKDRVECYIECTFPAPLNTVGLHIVSV